MTDKELVTELAQVIHAALREGRNASTAVMAVDLRPARAVLAWLAERGRLVPDGASIEEQWQTWCHGGDSDGIRLSSEYAEPSRERAEEWGREQIGRYGITRYAIVHRECRSWPDGTALITPWVVVPENPETTDG